MTKIKFGDQHDESQARHEVVSDGGESEISFGSQYDHSELSSRILDLKNPTDLKLLAGELNSLVQKVSATPQGHSHPEDTAALSEAAQHAARGDEESAKKCLARIGKWVRGSMGAESHTTFFSYSREDSDFAKKLAADLKSTGASVWMDLFDIEPGTRWDDAVSKALESSPRVLVILSPASVKSENVSDEVDFALSKQKHVIPVLYRECDVPFRLARLQYVDFRTNYDVALQELTQASL